MPILEDCEILPTCLGWTTLWILNLLGMWREKKRRQKTFSHFIVLSREGPAPLENAGEQER